MTRISHRLFLLLLLPMLIGMVFPAQATSRPENYVWVDSSNLAQCTAGFHSQAFDAYQESLGTRRENASGSPVYLYAQASPIDLDDPSGNYSSWEQWLGYESQDTIVADYRETHPWISYDKIISESRLKVKSSKYWYLKPDIVNYGVQPPLWLEIKPLSPAGVASGFAKYKLNTKLLLKGFKPDASWIPTFCQVTDDGVPIYVVNCGGVVYYVERDLVTDTASFAAGVAAGYAVDKLLKYVAQQVTVRGLQAIITRSTANLANSFAADMQATFGVVAEEEL